MGDIEATGSAFKKQGTFDLVERLLGRNMPKEDVAVYFDEAAGYQREKIEQALSTETDVDKVKELEEQLAVLDGKLNESKYTFHMTGISHKTYDKIIDTIREQYPIKYEDYINPLTGAKNKAELPDENRDQLYNTLFLTACIESVTDPEGATFEDVTPEVVGILLENAPADGIRALSEKANHLRMLGSWMDRVQTADF